MAAAGNLLENSGLVRLHLRNQDLALARAGKVNAVHDRPHDNHP